jgi:hypothetical protein
MVVVARDGIEPPMPAYSRPIGVTHPLVTAVALHSGGAYGSGF